jgi:F-type H+-transporting ATPase subunit epsilon
MPPDLMKLKILLPFQVFAEKAGVSRIVAETQGGSFGFLPHRLDCTAALVPGILTFEIEGSAPTYVALDEGVLIKTGMEVHISVRNAISGTDLGTLRKAVADEFINISDEERNMRSKINKLNTGLITRLVELKND